MEIKTLEGIPISSITAAFNEAFSDYFIKFSYTDENFERKIVSESIKLEYSPAAFVNERIVAFIINGLDEVNGRKCVFNGGTGVIPEYRGNRIVEKLYGYILPILKEKGYRHHQLEVFAGNDKAEKIYEKVGFSRSKNIAAFKGTVAEYNADDISFKPVQSIDWDVARSFCDVEPTWQNSTESIIRSSDKYQTIAVLKNDRFVGYVVIDPVSKRIKQFAIDKGERGKGIGRALFSYVNRAVGEVSFANYDTDDVKGVAFFKAMGLDQYFDSYEMRLFY